VLIALLIIAIITLRTSIVRTIVIIIATLQVIRTSLELLQSRLPAELLSVTSILLITTGRSSNEVSFLSFFLSFRSRFLFSLPHLSPLFPSSLRLLA